MLTKRKIILPMVVLALLFFLLPTAESQNLIQVKSDHPRIFITPSILPTLRNRAATTHSTTYGAIKTWCDENWNNSGVQGIIWTYQDDRIYDVGLFRYALIYLLGEIPGFSYSHTINEYGDKAVNAMLSLVTGYQNISNSSAMDAVGWMVPITYDWVNARMTTGQKTTVVNWFSSLLGTDCTSYWQYRSYFWDSTPLCFYPGLAFYGDGIKDTLAQTYVNFIPTYLQTATMLSHQSGKDGGIGGGMCYGRYAYSGTYWANVGTLPWDLYALTTATNLTVADTFDVYPYPKGFPFWIFWGIRPGAVHDNVPDGYKPVTGGLPLVNYEDCLNWHWNTGPADLPLINLFRLMATVYNSKGDTTSHDLLSWMANTKWGTPHTTSVFDIIVNDASTGSDPSTLNYPKVKAFGWNTSAGAIDSYSTNAKAGIGQVYMRSAWDWSDATYSIFRAPPYLYHGHQHMDSLSFYIFKKEPLALAASGKYYNHYEGCDPETPACGTSSPHSGYPHYYNYYSRTLSANSLLIMDPSESYTIWDSGYINTYRDGGQKARPFSNLFENTVPGSVYDRGGLIKHEDATDYTYTSADATIAYNSIINGTPHVEGGASPKVSLVQRDYVYLKSIDGNNDYFVVFDRIDSTNPSFKKVFLLHTIGEPVLNGPQTTVYGGTSGGLYQSGDSNLVTVTQPTAKLFMKTLLPSSVQIYKMGGNTATMTTASIDNTTGAIVGGPKINIPVYSTAEMPERPVVRIDSELFMCEGKTSNQLTNCIRGQRIWNGNPPASHFSGAVVTQDYTFMVRQVDTGDWISYTHYYGSGYKDGNGIVLGDTDEFGRWALRLETTLDETHTNFLNVLHPTTNVSRVMPPATLISSSGGNNMKGVLISDATPRIVMFSPTIAQVSNVTYDVAYSSTSAGKHLITGLVPSATYDISKNGTKIASKTASSQGIISFESTGGSNFRLLQTSGPIPPPQDTTSPSVPTNLTATAASSSQINLFWSSSTDDVGVSGYRIYRNGAQTATSTTNSFSDVGLLSSTTYIYTVAAYDAAGNVSGQSAAALVTTQASGDTTPPSRSNGSPIGTLLPGTAQTTLSLTTNENATCKYSTTAGTLYFSMTNAFSATGGTSHSTTVSGLSNGSTYNYYVRCVDASNNVNLDDYNISFSVDSSIPSPYVINDFNFYSTPSIPRPAKGVQFEDPTFHTRITRITDSATETPNSTSGNLAQAGYPKHDIENADGTKLIIQSLKSPCFHIWNANPPYNKIKDVPIPSGYECNQYGDRDLRWDNLDPDILYFYAGAKLYQHNVVSDALTVVHDFTNDLPGEVILRISTEEEGSPSHDRRYWAFLTWSQGADHQSHIIVYDKQTDSIISKLDWGAGTSVDGQYVYSEGVWIRDPNGNPINYNWVSMSPSGNYVVTGTPPGWLYPRNFSTTRLVAAPSHTATAIDDEGREVWFMVSHYFGPTGYTDYGYWAKMVDLATGAEHWLAPFGLVGQDHVSGNSRDRQGWAVVSSFWPDCGQARTQWSDGSVMMYELTRRFPAMPDWENHARVWRLADTHMCRKSYGDDPFAKINKKGTKVWFGSGWGQSYTDPGAQYDVYQIDLPATWWEDMKTLAGLPIGVSPPPPSLSNPANHSTGVSVTPTLSWTGALGQTYHIQVSTSSGFGTTVVDASGFSSTSYTVTPPLSYATDYYWRVKATTLEGGTGSWSAIFKFTTSVFGVPAPPVLSSPADGAIGVPLTATLSWSASPGATIYWAQVATDSTFANIVSESPSISGTTYSVTGLLNTTTYYWRVKAGSSYGWSSFSSMRSFTTVGSGVAPSPPGLAIPANGATGVDPNNVLFEEYDNSFAVKYHLQIDDTDGTFKSIVVDVVFGRPSRYLLTSGLLSGHIYYWRMSSINANGEGSFSLTQHFTTLMGFGILTSSLANGLVASNYSQNLQASGGTAPYTWSVLSGALPSGLSLSVSTGAISGTTTVAGTSNFTIQAQDSSSPSKTTSKALSITVNPVADTTPPAPSKGLRILR